MIKARSIDFDSSVKTMMFNFSIGENTATAALADRSIYIPVHSDGRVIEIGVTLFVAGGAANSGSVTMNFYRAGSATIASATTTSLFATGGILLNSGTAVGGIQTATLSTSVIVGPEAGMLVSAGTTLLVDYDFTATSTVNHVRGYIKMIIDDPIVVR